MIWLSVIGASLLWSPTFSQNQEKIKDGANKNLVTNLNWNQKLHESIIKMDIQDIFKINGKEKWLKLIRKHMTIEINKYRELNKKNPLLQDIVLDSAAQKFAEFGAPYKQLWHSFDWKSVIDMGVDMTWYRAIWENVAYKVKNISDIVSYWYYKSEQHKKNMIGLNKSKYTWKDISYDAVWIGISWDFIVVEFASTIE